MSKKPQAYVSKIERGERGVYAVELSELAKAYNKSLDYFIKWIMKWIIVIILSIIALSGGIWTAIGVFILGSIIISIINS